MKVLVVGVDRDIIPLREWNPFLLFYDTTPK